MQKDISILKTSEGMKNIVLFEGKGFESMLYLIYLGIFIKGKYKNVKSTVFPLACYKLVS